MPTYKAPVRDMRFLMNEVLDFESHYKTFPEGEEATPDMVEAIIGEMAKLCENTLAPLYQSGDEEGCKFEDGVVTTHVVFVYVIVGDSDDKHLRACVVEGDALWRRVLATHVE